MAKLAELKQATAHLNLLDRDAVINKGKLAYRMGIELRNNPEKVESAQGLWVIGWKKAEKEFDELLKRNGGNMR